MQQPNHVAINADVTTDWSIPTSGGGSSTLPKMLSPSSSVGCVSSLTAVTENPKPKILLMGLSRSGKTSIRHVIFHKMSANETQFLESTPKIDKIDISNKSFLNFQLWDMPGKLNITQYHKGDGTLNPNLQTIFRDARILIFVIDPMEEHNHALENLHNLITVSRLYNPDLKIEVFIHKSDGLTDEQKVETIRELTHSINSKLVHSGHGDLYICFRTTSIYDHSIFEAMSMACQQLLENILQPFENLLNAFVSSNKMEKAFIFDVHSKVFLATDSSPFDMPVYELCCDMLDLIFDLGCIYNCRGMNYSEYHSDRIMRMGGDDNVDWENSEDVTISAIRLNDTVLHFKQINSHLALVCTEQTQNGELSPTGLLDYNFSMFKNGINEILEIATL